MKPPFPRSSLSSFALLLSCALLGLMCFVLYYKDLNLQSLMSPCRPSPSTNLTNEAVPEPDFRLFVGVLTHPDHYERRHLIRLVYSLQPKAATAQIDMRFIFCNLTKEDQQVLIALEIMRYDDIVILDCAENMDHGKTYTYFSSLPRLLNGTNGDGRPYDYVMKTDDDMYFLLDRLAEVLRKTPREDMYYGFVTPCDTPQSSFHYMSGMGYILSWDLVEWIATSEIPKKRLDGPEDLVLGEWLKKGNRAKNMIDSRPAMYDYRRSSDSETCFRHEFVPDTIGVHKLKDNPMWAAMLKYFNATDGFKPSKFYRIS